MGQQRHEAKGSAAVQEGLRKPPVGSSIFTKPDNPPELRIVLRNLTPLCLALSAVSAEH